MRDAGRKVSQRADQLSRLSHVTTNLNNKTLKADQHRNPASDLKPWEISPTDTNRLWW